MAQPASNSWRYAEDGLVIGSSLVAPDKATHHIPVMNLSDTTQTLPEGTRLGDIYPVESFKHVEEMLWVDSDLSDCESDDDELTDVQSKVHLPRNLMPMMTRAWIPRIFQSICSLSWSAYQNISPLVNVFSSGPEDMGQTDFVTHTIDTGEDRPILLPHRRLPITKQDVEKAEVQKMPDRGNIEPWQSS